MESRFRVLLVEDDADYAMLVSLRLGQACGETLGYLMESVPDLASALRLLGGKAFDVVLLDLMLPDSEGLETLRRLKRATDAPVVVLTNMSEDAVGREAVAAGAQDVLIKSRIDVPSLQRAVDYAMERSRAAPRVEEVVEGFPDGVVIVGLDGVVLYANRRALELLGRKEAELVGRRFPHPLGDRRLELRGRRERRTLDMRVSEIGWHGTRARLASLREVPAARPRERRVTPP